MQIDFLLTELERPPVMIEADRLHSKNAGIKIATRFNVTDAQNKMINAIDADHEGTEVSCFAILLSRVPNHFCSVPVNPKPKPSYSRIARVKNGVVLRIKRL